MSEKLNFVSLNKSSKPHTKVSHKFPKANQILDRTDYQPKSIYPFQMKSITHQPMPGQQQPYQLPNNKRLLAKFKPVLPTVSLHFDKKYLIYDKFNNNCDQELFNQNIFSLQKLKNLKNSDYVCFVEETFPFVQSEDEIIFDSRFESGNLSLVSHIFGVYYLLLQNDVNTSGYTSWFYFSTKNNKKGTYKFAILNYGKAGWMHNQGVKICVHDKVNGWRRNGENILCQSNASIFEKCKYQKFNTLYFEYTFDSDNSEVFFSYNVPYTYSDLCSLLDHIDSKNLNVFHRKLAGVSLAGNRIEEITVTNFDKTKEQISLPVIILMARAHPGETVSSWIMHEFLNFIVSADSEAIQLRNNFVFKLFPMVNPDGVIHGNYRCSLSGRDLNRKWSNPNKDIFPQIYFVKKIIVSIQKKRQIKIILDLHGHTQKKNIFAYGCNDKNEHQKCRLFPYIVSKLTPFFQFRFCNYYMDKSKLGTARLTLFNLFKIPFTYTIQTSQFGTIFGHHSSKVFKEISLSFAKSFAIIFKIPNDKQQILDVDQFSKELQSDPNLLKIGNDPDGGSDSQPSVDNIKFDKLTKMTNRKTKKISSSPNSNTIKTQDNDSQVINKLKTSITMRPRSSSMTNKRYEQREPRKSLFMQTRFSSFRSQVESNYRSKIEEKLQNRQAQRIQIFSSKRKPERINFINLSLSVYEDEKVARTTKLIPTIYDIKRQYEDQILKMGIGRKHSHFRKLN